MAPAPASVESESGSQDDFHDAVEWMKKDEKEKGEDKKERRMRMRKRLEITLSL